MLQPNGRQRKNIMRSSKKIARGNLASRIRFLTQGAMTAALYVGLTFLSYACGLDKGAVQLRLSEALCVLGAFTPAAIPGVSIGCFLANIFTNCHPLDVVFGTLATLLGVLGSYALRFLLRKKIAFCLISLPNIFFNTLIVPLVLQYAYGVTDGYFFLVLTVGAGELLSSGFLGALLALSLKKRSLFSQEPR